MRATASSVVLKRERVAREHQQARDREAVSVTPHARARTTDTPARRRSLFRDAALVAFVALNWAGKGKN